MILCAFLVWLTATTAVRGLTLDAFIILTKNSNLSNDYKNVGPALDLAFEECRTLHNVGMRVWKGVYEGYCSETTVLSKVFEAINRSMDFIVGPACGEDFLAASKLAYNFQMPILTGSADSVDSTKDYPYSTRLSTSFYSQWLFFVIMCTRYKWTNVAIVYDTKTRVYAMNAFSLSKYLTAAGLNGNMVEMNGNAVFGFESAQKMLLDAKASARIVVLLVSAPRIRQILIQAHRMDMANGEYAFFAADLFQQTILGGYGWQQSDLYDVEAKAAFMPLFVCSLMDLRSNPSFVAFEKKVRAIARGGEFEKTMNVNYYSATFHDIVLFYCQLVNKTGEGERDPYGAADATAVYDIVNTQFKNRTFYGGALGPILFDNNGDSVADFQLYQMNAQGVFAVVANYSGASGQYFEMDELRWMSSSGSPPANSPRCGYDGYDPKCLEEVRSALIGGLVGVIAGLLVASLIGFLVFRVVRSRAELSNLEWIAGWHEISFYRVTSNSRSVSSIKTQPVVIDPSEAPALKTMRTSSTTTSKQSPSVNRDSIGKNSTSVASFRSQLVLVRGCPGVVIGLNRAVRNEVRLVKGLLNENICKFIAACIEPDHTSVLVEYCSRGTLQDVLYNDRLVLDWVFRLSFMNDIIRGLACIQESPLLKHGRLTSKCCFVDKRFVLKIGDYGLDCFFRRDPSKLDSGDLLWTAPEILRAGKFAEPTADADSYSFAIILSEIILRESPYFQNKSSYDDIIVRVARGVVPPFRPAVEDPFCHPEILFVMRSCWAELPGDRLKLSQIRSCLRSVGKATGFEKVSIIDTLLERMEQHTENLESTVEEKTQALLEEKKKTDQLLYSILPKHAAEQLKRGERVLPESYDTVTIYFGDIVGFTTLCAESTPTEIVNLMNDLYSRFDQIIEKFDAYKVETIGDCYVVVSGLPHRNGHRHAPEIARLAFALRSCIGAFQVKHKPSKRLQLRIGMNSGPCVAGVVGFATPRYCLFGDTVNVASRMETTGEAMRIQITQSTCNLLHAFANFRTEFRGKIPVKGKGEMSTYWLLDEVDPGKGESIPAPS